MKRCSSAPLVSLALIFLLTLLAPAAHADSDASFRADRVRAFAPESTQSVVIREGRSRFVRLTFVDSCPALARAERIAFQVGSGLFATEQDGASVPMVRNTVPTVVSSETRHAHVVAINGNSRVACRLAGVTPADQAAFDMAAAVHGSHDNRYAGDGRPAD